MISPRTGRRARAHRVTHGALAFALVLGLSLGAQGAAAPTAVADTQDAADDGTVRLSLTAGLHGVVASEAPVTATLTVDNGSDEPVPAGRLTVEINKTPLSDSDELTAWLTAGDAAGSFTSLGTTEADEVAASDSSTTSISASAAAIGDIDAGVYPIRGRLSGESSAGILGTTSVLIVDADSSREITVLVPITATPEDGGLLTAEELDELTAPDGALTAQLDGVAGTSAVLAVDPLIPAAIRALGTAAPTSATAWLTRLESLSNERFTLQAGDADATVQARAGLDEPLEPLPLTPYLLSENFIEPTPSPSPSPSPTPTAPEMPDYEELTAIRSSEDGILWPLGDAQPGDLAVFDEYLDADATTILPSTSLSTGDAPVVDVDGHRALAVTADASAALSEAAAAPDDEASREQAITTAIAHLAYTGSQPALIGLARDETRTADSLREAILSLSTVAQPATLVALEKAKPASASLVGETSTARVDTLHELLDGESALTTFSSVLEDPLVLLSPERIEIMRLMGVGSAENLAAGAGAHSTATTATLDAVSVQQPSPIQLFTSAAPLPVWVRNDLPWPVNVTLHSRPSDARLDIQPETPVEAQPASNTRATVPVEARVGSGVLDVDFRLTSPTGVHIGTDQTATVTVRAEWEGIGLGILGGVIGLLLVLGIVRTIVRRRKSDETDAAASDSPES
ncbi:DUF6049 family protein [Microbacterium sp.]|uniref:DUF6049 family protein n=1 Tax=Microbacterium sp. TaxID=51671 RepID=UPI003F94C384